MDTLSEGPQGFYKRYLYLVLVAIAFRSPKPSFPMFYTIRADKGVWV